MLESHLLENSGLENISQLYQADQPQRVRQAHYT